MIFPVTASSLGLTQNSQVNWPSAAHVEEGTGSAREEGRKQGTLQKTCALIQKKLEKGKTISEIADELEDTEENIARLIEEFHLRIN